MKLTPTYQLYGNKYLIYMYHLCRPRGPVVRGPTVCPPKVANWAPVVRSPTVRPEKVANWAPEMYHPKRLKIINQQTRHPKCKQGCSQISNMFPEYQLHKKKYKIYQFKRPNNHPKLHNHHPKYKKIL